MIITASGLPGAGKSTITGRLADELGYEFYNMGRLFRDVAKKRNMTLVEYLEYGEQHPEVDTEMDDYQKELGETKDNFIIDSRMGWYFIPQSIKVFFSVEPRVGAERIFQDLQKSNDRNEGTDHETVEDVIKTQERRMNTDSKRYLELYDINPFDHAHHDIVVDTTDKTPDEVFQETLKKLQPFLTKKS
ncbi:MAG: (d)CMP kinase [Patescibacteria group bacterium]